MDTWQWHHGFSGGGLVMDLLWIIVAFAVGLVVYILLRDRGNRADPPHGDRTHEGAKQVLQERYARGEIERREYLEKLRDLER